MILDTKAPGHAPAFKGGFLGIGGVKVSDAEKATLGDIAKALGTSAQSCYLREEPKHQRQNDTDDD